MRDEDARLVRCGAEVKGLEALSDLCDVDALQDEHFADRIVLQLGEGEQEMLGPDPVVLVVLSLVRGLVDHAKGVLVEVTQRRSLERHALLLLRPQQQLREVFVWGLPVSEHATPEATKLALLGAERLPCAFELGELRRDRGEHGFARRAAWSRQQRADLSQREAELLRALYQRELIERLHRVLAVPRSIPRGWWEQPELFVVAKRRRRHSGPVREFAHTHGENLILRARSKVKRRASPGRSPLLRRG